MTIDWQGLRVISLKEGDFRVSGDANVCLSTILGSCVSVCLFDPVVRIGGMNHFLLPRSDDQLDQSARYGAYAIEVMINHLLRAGAARHNLIAKAVGAGNVSLHSPDIGARNAAFTQTFLTDEGIRCEITDLGGYHARRVHFHPASGRLRVLRIPKQDVVDIESGLRQRRTLPAPDISLF